MQLVLTNNGERPVPIMSSQDKGFADALPVGEPYVLDRPDTTVAIVGDKPDFLDELKDGVEQVLEFIKNLLTLWRQPDPKKGNGEPPNVDIAIDNQGTNAVRVILGSNVNDFELQPGNVYVAISPGYIELRELGV